MEQERDVEKYLTAQAKKIGGLSYKWTCPGQDGVPDRIIIMPGGHVYFVELKTYQGRLSQIQKHQINKIREKGAAVYILYGKKGVDCFIEDIKGDMNEIKTTRLSEESF